MTIGAGTRIGACEVIGSIGAGGMGEVYRARDTRLDRDVALKVLPEIFAADPDRLMRFTREAKTLAALNHPNIAGIHGIEEIPASGQAPAIRALVMEFIEGDDLSAVIARGALPVPEALAIARQVAEALEAAHEAGVIHRDLKPANIKVRDDGTVKVLDFGLAKGIGGDATAGGSSASVSLSPTMTSPAMTAMGMILGTAAYMSPEQARGKPVDRRADVWAFGVVLHEMLTGRRLFAREEVSDTLAAVLTAEPDRAALPASTPPAIRRLIARCLAKDRRQRLDSMAVARLEIAEAAATNPAGAIGSSGSSGPARARLAVGAALLLGGVAGGWLLSTIAARPVADAGAEPTVIAQIGAPREVIAAFHDGFALSPDGSRLAFTARNPTGLRQIWVRRLETDQAQPIAGTDGALYPFWAPDNRTVGFFADVKLKRVDVDGTRLQTLAETTGRNGSWSVRDEILYEELRGGRRLIMKVAAAGGAPVAFEALGRGFAPVWLGDGRRFLFAGGVNDAEWGVRLASPDGTSSALVTPLDLEVTEYTYGGGILFLNRNDTLTAQGLDEAAGTLTGAAVSIGPLAGTPKDWFAVSSNGRRLVGLMGRAQDDHGNPGDPMAKLIWVDRQGRTVGTLGESGRYWTLRLAPDGAGAVVNPGPDLWLLRPQGRQTRLTTGGFPRPNMSPVWSRDGLEIVSLEPPAIVRRRVDQQGQPLTLEGARGRPFDWSPDRRWLLTGTRATETSTTPDIAVYDLERRTLAPWLATDFVEISARFSADGRWVAYSSNVSGREEVYVRPFDGSGPPIAVSTSGGAHPIWSRANSELFFLSPGDDLMVAPLMRSGAALTSGPPTRLFRVPLNDITRGSWAPYDVSPDGQRFLLNVPDSPAPLFFLQGLDRVLAR